MAWGDQGSSRKGADAQVLGLPKGQPGESRPLGMSLWELQTQVTWRRRSLPQDPWSW